MEKINIAYIITRLDWAGPPDVLRLLIKNLQKDYNITLIYGLTKYPNEKTKLFLKEIKAIYIPQLRREINLFYDLVAFLKLYFLFKKNNFKIIHTHTAKAGILARLAGFFLKIQIIIHSPHGHNFYGYFNKFFSYMIVLIERVFSKFTTAFIVSTNLEKKDMLNFKITSEEKIYVIPLGIEDSVSKLSEEEKINIRKKYSINDNEIVIGTISRLEPIKGIEYLIDAIYLVSLKFDYVKFIITGDGSLKNFVMDRIKKLNLSKKVILAGWLDNINQIINIFDIFVLASLNEAFGLAIIYAQKIGIPVIATRVGGIPEVVLDKKSGILVNPKDSNALACAMSYLILNKEKRKEMGNFAFNYMKDKFKVSSMVDSTKNLYQFLLKKYI